MLLQNQVRTVKTTTAALRFKNLELAWYCLAASVSLNMSYGNIFSKLAAHAPSFGLGVRLFLNAPFASLNVSASSAFLAAFFQGGLMQVSAARQQPLIKQAYLGAVLRQDLAWMDMNPPGKIQSTISQDIDLITDAMGDKLGEAVQTIVQFVLGLSVGFFVSWQLSLLTLGLVPVLALSMVSLMKTITGLSAMRQKTAAVAASLSQESTGSIRTVCALNVQGTIVDRYAKEALRIQMSAEKFHRALAFSLGLFMFTIYCSYSLALWYGSVLVEDGVITGTAHF